MMKLQHVKQSIPQLIELLSKIPTQYSYESRCIGSAIAYLLLLGDLIEGEKQEQDKKELYPKAYATLGADGKWIFTNEKLYETSKPLYV